MKALVQRVLKSSVSIDSEAVGVIGRGLVVLLGVARDDTTGDAEYLAQKVANIRVFPRDEAEFDLSLLDIEGEALVVSQFTLMADARKGRRPSFADAAPPEIARPLYEHFVATLHSLGLRVQTGRFQEYMQVEIHNDGPVTFMLESRPRR